MRWRSLICPLLITLTLTVFWQVHAFDFVNFDDGKYVAENLLLKDGLTLTNFGWAFTTTYFSNWHPFVWLSYLLDAQLFGIDASAFHRTSVAFHVANVLLLFVFMRQMTESFYQSAFVASVFAVHPLNVESVAWISSRKDVLSMFFGLLSLIAYVRYVRHPSRLCFWVSVTAFGCSLMSKQMLVTLPFVMLLLDYWPLRRTGFQLHSGDLAVAHASGAELHSGNQDAFITNRIRRLAFEKMPYFVLSAVLSMVAFGSQSQSGSMELLKGVSFGGRCLNAVLVYGLYICKTIWPRNLSVFYPHPGHSLSWQAVSLSAFVLVAITVFVFMRVRRYPYVAVGWFWYLGTLVPVIGLVQTGRQQMADRYMYLPMVGLLLAVAWLVPEILVQRRWKRYFLTFLSLSIITALTIVSRNQILHWRNSITLFQHAIQVTRVNDLAHNNLGLAQKEAGRIPLAFTRFQEALRINPENAEAHNNLGNLLQETNRVKAAIPHLRRAVELDDRFADAYNNLGNTLKSMGRFDEAISSFKRALEIDPVNATYYSNAGVSLYEAGRLQEALRYFETALRIDPRYVFVHINLGVVLYKQARFGDAIRQFREVRRLEPHNEHARYFEANAHFAAAGERLKRGSQKDAITHLRSAVELRPDFADAYNELGLVRLQQGGRDAAIKNFRHAIRINPDFAAAKTNLRHALEAK